MTADRRVEVRIMRLPHAADLPLPQYQSALAAGVDLVAAVASDKPVTLAPGARALIPTGLALGLPPGYEGQVRPEHALSFQPGWRLRYLPVTRARCARAPVLRRATASRC